VALLAQLRPGGRMAIPIGPQDGPQRLMLIRKAADGTITQEDALAVAFVPLVEPRRTG
jgi:protein-L-isoaspartate(D-aspartate) O-methyltransferase